MVGPSTVAFDISSVAISTAVPGVAWALWFAIAWKRPAFAESLGLGRREFWLLLPGALLSSFALLPFLPVGSDILAVSFAGAVFPLAVGVLALGRISQPLRTAEVRLFAPLAAEAAVLLGLVVVADRGDLNGAARSVGLAPWPFELVLVAAVCAVATAAAWTLRAPGPGGRAPAGAFGLINGVLVLTFAGASAIPGVGIAESFPYYLLPPLLVGVIAVLLAPHLFEGHDAFALPLAFLAGGWGVLLGADALWQPPLYGHGSGGLYAVGGAGVVDLVYLSGFLALIGAWGTHRLLGRGTDPSGVPLPEAPPNPSGLVREAYALGIDGQVQASLRTSAEAVRAAASQARRLLDAPPRDGGRPWDGVAVPGWVVSDTANLESSAGSGASDPREAVRGWLTARALVRLGEGLSRSRFATIRQRTIAFLIDSALLGGAGAAVFAAIVLGTPGNLNAVLGSVVLNAAIYGLVAGALLYFALSEIVSGATVGKRLVGIEVRDRSLSPVGGVAAFVRNTPLLPSVTLYSIGVSLGVAIALRGLGPGGNIGGLGLLGGTVALVSIGLVVVAGIVFAGALGVIVIRLTAEHQRVGDLWAGTWVVRRVTPKAATSPAPGAGRFG